MLTNLLLINFTVVTTLLALSPPKPGIIPSSKVQQYQAIMSADYHSGGLVTMMQRVKQSNIDQAANGERDFRDDVYVSFPVILGSYADENDLDTVRTMLQYELFDGPWPSVTMAEHYEEMSYDQFHLSGSVYGWYALDNNGEYYEGSQSEPYDNGFNGPPGGAGAFLKDALDLADPEIDFSQYDNDGPDGIPNSGDDDGFVDATFFVHSGRGGEGGGPYIWSHRWTYAGWWGSAYTTNDTGANGSAIKVNDYIVQPAVSTGGGLIEIGVFSHEFGHALGLPDLYDTDYSSNGVGSWCLMASGSWSTPSSPTHMSAWCKEMLGWVVPVFPDENLDSLEFPNVEQNPYVVKLWTHGELDPYSGSYSHGQDVGQEYFLIENRQRIGTEIHLPGTGLLIWHIDNSLWTNSDENHRMVDMKAADNYFNGSNAGDPWPGTTDNRNFDYETLPPAIGWAGTNTEVAVLNISDSDTSMWADIEVHEVNPHVNVVDMLISDTNGDHIYAPGETVQIWLVVENSGGPASDLTASLTATAGAISLLGDTVDFDALGFMETGTSNLPFEFEISDTLSPQPINFDIIFNSTELQEPQHHAFTLMLGLPDVAIIDDDGALTGDADYQAYYTQALEVANIVYTSWDVEELGLPSLSWLQENSKLIWYTGDHAHPLDNQRIALLTDYLEAGGNLLLGGQDVSTGDLSVETFIADYFAAEVNSEDVNTSYVYGDPDHPLMSAADHYSISNASGAHNQTSPDGFNVLSGGTSLFMYPFVNNLPCGVSVKNTTYSSILLGFGMESLAAFGGDPDTVRADLFKRMLDWLDLTATEINPAGSGLPEQRGIVAAYPNPFNPEITFRVGLRADEQGELQIVDLRGTIVQSLAVFHQNQVTWIPTNNQSAGLYFVRLFVGGQIRGSWQKVTYLK